MKKQFTWKDLKTLERQLPDGRSKSALQRILKGEVVDITTVGNNPNARPSRRSPASFRYDMKRMVEAHEGLELHDGLLSIPNLLKH
jgi:hypothetical protein